MKWKGSYTIEMALIMPIVLLTLVSFLLLTFRMHDAGVLQAAAYELIILEGSRTKNPYGFILSEEPEKRMTVTDHKICAEVKGIHFVTLERKRTKPVSFIRRCRKTAQIGKEREVKESEE